MFDKQVVRQHLIIILFIIMSLPGDDGFVEHTYRQRVIQNVHPRVVLHESLSQGFTGLEYLSAKQ